MGRLLDSKSYTLPLCSCFQGLQCLLIENILEDKSSVLNLKLIRNVLSLNIMVIKVNQFHIEGQKYIHYENLPMQYTEIFKIVKNENFQ